MNRTRVFKHASFVVLALALTGWLGSQAEAAAPQGLCNGGAICAGGCVAIEDGPYSTGIVGPEPPGNPFLNFDPASPIPNRADAIPKFNSNLGTLQAIKVQFTARPVLRRFQQENQANFACPALPPGCQVRLAADQLQMGATGAPSVLFQDGLPPPNANLFGVKIADIVPLPAFDGVLDYAVGGSGDANCTPAGVDENYENFCTVPDGADIQTGSGYTVCFPDGPTSIQNVCVTAGLAGYQAPGGVGNINSLLTISHADASFIDDLGLGCPRTAFTRRIRLEVTATVTYVYCPPNVCPTANPDDAVVCRNVAACPSFVDIPVLANDCDEDQGCPGINGKLNCGSLAITTQPANGTVQIMGCAGPSALTDCPQVANCPGCVVRYTPNAGFSGTDSFCYTVDDTLGATSAPAAVSIRVRPPPDAVDDALFRTCIGVPITLNVLANDVGAPATASSPGTACAGQSDCTTAPLPPKPFPATAATTINCGSLTILTQPTHGTLQVGQACTGLTGNCNGGANCIRYTPNAGYCGFDSFTYRVSDSAGCCDTATVTIRIFPPPVAVPDTATICESGSCDGEDCVVIGVLANDQTCPGGAACTVCNDALGSSPINCSSLTITQQPANGVISIVPCNGVGNGGCTNQCVRYCPNPGFSGVDAFKYKFTDSRSLPNPPGTTQSDGFPCMSNEATVTINVLCAPTAVPDAMIVDVNNPVEVCVNVLANDDPCPGAVFPPNAVSLLPRGPGCRGEPAEDYGTVTLNGNEVCFTPTSPLPPGGVYIRYKIINSHGVDFPQCCDESCIIINPVECIDRNRRVCASLLLYPEFDNRPGIINMLSITDGCCIDSSVKVEFRFIQKDTCLKTDQTFTLTACDTLTFLTSGVNSGGPNARGYAYAYAKNDVLTDANPTGTPIVYNHLIGQELILDGINQLSYSMNAVAFRGLGLNGADTDGLPNDDDGDGIRDLNGPGPLAEYEEAPDEIHIPRFLGQDGPEPAGFQSELILIALSGGSQFTTEVDYLVYNDNEVPFSGNYTFFCWDKPLLRDFAPQTLQSFLVGTAHDLDEIVGNPLRESGWIRIDGNVANSTGPETINDPAVYAVLIERYLDYIAADLPFEYCLQVNGALLPNHLLGDGDPTPVADDDQ